MGLEACHTLVHASHVSKIVKHTVVFGSPRRLNLQVVCHPTPVRKMLDIWPPLPIVINQSDKLWQSTWGTNNTIATLKHNDRIPVLTDLICARVRR
jgi:hypothetical protein